MKITKKSEYALLALIHLAKCYNLRLCTVKEISEKNNIPKKFLEQIFNVLRTNGYIKSTRGPGGGFSLAKSPENITVAEIYRLIDGYLAPIQSVSNNLYKKTPSEQNEKVIALMRDIRNYISDKLEQTTIKDLI